MLIGSRLSPEIKARTDQIPPALVFVMNEVAQHQLGSVDRFETQLPVELLEATSGLGLVPAQPQPDATLDFLGQTQESINSFRSR